MSEMKDIEARFQLSTADLREAVWEWLNFYRLVKEVKLEDIAFSEEHVTAHVRARIGPK